MTIRVPEVDQLKTLYGTKSEDTAGLLLKSALGAFGRKAEAYFELMPAMAVEMEPRDAVEAMLVTQIAATHIAITTMSQNFHHAPSTETGEAFERSTKRPSRTFLAQMDQLKKYPAKAAKRVSLCCARLTASPQDCRETRDRSRI